MSTNAIITGSTSGIGLGIAHALADDGVNVTLNGLESPDDAEPIRAEIAARYGVQARYSDANMLEPDQIAAMVNEAEREMGSVDVLVNNAGIQHVAPIEEFPDSKWEAIIGINLSSAFYATKAAIPAMKQRGWGRIINIASAHGLVASPYKSAYVAAKHGMLGLTKTVALETAREGITVNAICPGYVKTPMVEDQIPDTAKARGMSEEEVVREVILDAQPTKEFVETEQIGALAVFLCSRAAASITGTALPMDGGWTAQ
ncbi:MAG: 3-hydroxybutyrate dehydrogenase [Arhodomonas sp.]|nr:3-hydroxybutyrate dehydrogenase [Arhodomonas sp.]